MTDEMKRVHELELWAWIGADDSEEKTGVLGLKQARTPAGMIPLAAVTPGKLEQDYIRVQMRELAASTGVRRYLVRFRVEEIEEVMEP